jgi:hypothetical protein
MIARVCAAANLVANKLNFELNRRPAKMHRIVPKLKQLFMKTKILMMMGFLMTSNIATLLNIGKKGFPQII